VRCDPFRELELAPTPKFAGKFAGESARRGEIGWEEKGNPSEINRLRDEGANLEEGVVVPRRASAGGGRPEATRRTCSARLPVIRRAHGLGSCVRARNVKRMVYQLFHAFHEADGTRKLRMGLERRCVRPPRVNPEEPSVAD
jgi:hypothetical protein